MVVTVVYVVVVYDMEADRTQKMLKLLRQYLVHVQYSVFEGEITEGTLEELKGRMEELLKEGESTIVYELGSESLLDRTVYGQDPTEEGRFL